MTTPTAYLAPYVGRATAHRTFALRLTRIKQRLDQAQRISGNGGRIAQLEAAAAVAADLVASVEPPVSGVDYRVDLDSFERALRVLDVIGGTE